MMIYLELASFLLGSFFLLRWLLRSLTTFYNLYFDTRTTIYRYGPRGTWACVTGSTDGIGKAIALELAARGFNIVLISRTLSKLNSVASEVQKHGVETRVLAFDFSDDTSIEAYRELAAKMKDLDVSVLVNNVGTATNGDPSLGALVNELIVNCYPIVFLTQHLLPQLISHGQKRRSLLINLSSQTALVPCPSVGSYAATKAFDDYLTEGLRQELKS